VKRASQRLLLVLLGVHLLARADVAQADDSGCERLALALERNPCLAVDSKTLGACKCSGGVPVDSADSLAAEDVEQVEACGERLAVKSEKSVASLQIATAYWKDLSNRSSEKVPVAQLNDVKKSLERQVAETALVKSQAATSKAYAVGKRIELQDRHRWVCRIGLFASGGLAAGRPRQRSLGLEYAYRAEYGLVSQFGLGLVHHTAVAQDSSDNVWFVAPRLRVSYGLRLSAFVGLAYLVQVQGEGNQMIAAPQLGVQWRWSRTKEADWFGAGMDFFVEPNVPLKGDLPTVVFFNVGVSAGWRGGQGSASQK